MFDCCSRKKPSKTSLIDQLRYTAPINLGLSERINLVFDEENKRWKSGTCANMCIISNISRFIFESRQKEQFQLLRILGKGSHNRPFPQDNELNDRQSLHGMAQLTPQVAELFVEVMQLFKEEFNRKNRFTCSRVQKLPTSDD